jgi:endonuclease/exonuclease/phosphatase family metal-dependent hydrolase
MKLRFLTWNIGFAYGPGSDGIQRKNQPGYQPLAKSHFLSGLESISHLLRELQIDVAFLQEVDFDSSRSWNQNQLDLLARSSGLNYRLPIISWNLPYVPYPGLDPRFHFGKVVSGGGVISRFPIHLIQNQLLPKPKENSYFYNLFYLYRYLQIFKISLPQRELQCMNLHLEAFSQDNRELHLIRLQDRLLDYDIAISGGDFNGPTSLMPERSKDWNIHMAPEPTFPETDEKLDGWILRNGLFQIHEMKTLDTGTISDHLPVLMELELL